MSALLCEQFPDDYMNRLFSITEKSVAFSESSYSAQAWTTSGPPVLTFNGSQEKQQLFAEQMLSESDSKNAYFVIWFVVRDYDTLWSETLGSADDALVWRDTGLYDEYGNPRLAHYSWMREFGKEYKR